MSRTFLLAVASLALATSCSKKKDDAEKPTEPAAAAAGTEAPETAKTQPAPATEPAQELNVPAAAAAAADDKVADDKVADDEDEDLDEDADEEEMDEDEDEDMGEDEDEGEDAE